MWFLGEKTGINNYCIHKYPMSCGCSGGRTTSYEAGQISPDLDFTP